MLDSNSVTLETALRTQKQNRWRNGGYMWVAADPMYQGEAELHRQAEPGMQGASGPLYIHVRVACQPMV